jgi:hypothetical protein
VAVEQATGRVTMCSVNLGEERETSIYGWFYSITSLILPGRMIAIVILDRVFISRPALDHDEERYVHIRTVRARSVLVVGTGEYSCSLSVGSSWQRYSAPAKYPRGVIVETNDPKIGEGLWLIWGVCFGWPHYDQKSSALTRTPGDEIFSSCNSAYFCR